MIVHQSTATGAGLRSGKAKKARVACHRCSKVRGHGDDFRRAPDKREVFLCIACYWFQKRNGSPRPWSLIEKDRHCHNKQKLQVKKAITKPRSPSTRSKAQLLPKEENLVVLAAQQLETMARVKPVELVLTNSAVVDNTAEIHATSIIIEMSSSVNSSSLLDTPINYDATDIHAAMAILELFQSQPHLVHNYPAELQAALSIMELYHQTIC
jgi:hypothetical protein